MYSVLENYPCCINVSVMGAGKTPMSLHYAYDKGYKNMLVICPAAVCDNWLQESRNFEIGNTKVLTSSYAKLRGQSGRVTSEYVELDKPRTVIKDGKIKNVYKPSRQFLKLIRKGLLLVIDECHMASSQSSLAYKSCIELIDCIVDSYYSTRGEPKPRCILLSATPGHKLEHIKYITRFTSLTEHKLNRKGGVDRPQILEGIEDVVKFCKDEDGNYEEGTREIIERYKYPAAFRSGEITAMVNAMALDLWDSYIKYHFLCNARLPPNTDRADFRNAICLIEGEKKVRKYKDAISLLSRVYQKMSDDSEKESGQEILKDMAKAMQDLEDSKKDIMFDMLMQEITEKPKSKVVCFCLYNKTLDYIYSRLPKGYKKKCVEIRGEGAGGIAISSKKRKEYVGKFQQHDNRCRIALVNIMCGSTGINLDDTSPGGKYPRTVLEMPTYMFVQMQQSTGRCLRTSTVLAEGAKVKLRFIYGAIPFTENRNIETCEVKIINSIMMKTGYATKIRGTSENMFYPSEYDETYGKCFVRKTGNKVVSKIKSVDADEWTETDREWELEGKDYGLEPRVFDILG